MGEMIEKDLETARLMASKEDGTIFLATDRLLWQSVVSHTMLD